MAAVAVRPSATGVDRRRQAGLVVAALAVALFVVYIALWSELPGSFRTGNDFAPTYAAGQFILQGHATAVYDESRILAAERATGAAGSTIDLPFISPPAAALLFTPLSRLTLTSAEAVYSLAQLLAIVAAVVLIALKVPWPASTPAAFRAAVAAGAIGAPTVGALLLFGESDGLLTLAMTAAYLLLVGRQPVAAGVALGLAAGLGKPHLLVGVLVFLLCRHAVSVVVSSLVTAVTVNLVAIALLGPSAAIGFVSAVLHSGIDHPPSGLVGIGGLVSSWFGNGATVRVIGLVACAIVVGLCARLGAMSRKLPSRTPELLAAVFALTLLCSPHLLTPDMVVLVPAFLWLYPSLLSGRVPRWRPGVPEVLLLAAWVCLGVATVMDAGNGAVGWPGRVTPWGLMLFAFAAWRAAAPASESSQSMGRRWQRTASTRG
jgi:hypothetical protein